MASCGRRRPMSNETRYTERQKFVMEPDHYDGVECDKTRPRWMTGYAKYGDEEHGETLEFSLSAANFPPGTKVTIEVPVCPKCGDPADFVTGGSGDTPQKEWPKCDCGFDWQKWSEDTYS